MLFRSLNHSGILDVLTGTLSLDGGIGQFFSGAVITGAGTTRLYGIATTLTGTVSASHLDLASGSLSVNSAATLNGQLTWSAGILTGTGTLTIPVGSTLTVSAGGGPKYLDLATLNNAGTLNVTSASWYGEYGAVLNNTGTLDLQGDYGLGWLYGARPTVNNFGLLRKSAGAGTTTFNYVNFNQSGLLKMLAGTVNFASGKIGRASCRERV